MFTNNLKNRRNKTFEIENNKLKREMLSLKKSKSQNNSDIFYNNEFINSVKEKPNTSRTFSMIKSIPVININDEYLKHQFGEKKQVNVKLTNRTQNCEIEDNFYLKFKSSNSQNKLEELDINVNKQHYINIDDEDEDDDNSYDSENIDSNTAFDINDLDNENEILMKINRNIQTTAIENIVDISNNNNINELVLRNYINKGNEINNYHYDVEENSVVEYKIPLVCYTTWHTKNLPPQMKNNYTELCENNPEIQFLLFDEKECNIFIENNFSEQVLYAYNSLYPSSYKSDLWRYCILFINGGIYLDIKYNTVNNFKLKHLCLCEHFCFDHIGKKTTPIWNKNEFGVYTSLIVTKKNNPILKLCIDNIVKNVNTFSYGKNALYPTGPGLLGQCLINIKYNNNMEFINDIDLFHHHDSNAIIYNNTAILDIYKSYREEQKEYQNNLHYSELWQQRCIYNMNNTILHKKINNEIEEHLPNVLCIIHIGSYHIFLKMKQYVDNLIRAKYDQYNLTMYINIINTIRPEHISQIKQLYSDENIIISDNYGFDIGSFFHILHIIKKYNEQYDYVIKLHTKTNHSVRNELLTPILGDIHKIRNIIEIFRENGKLGIITSKKSRCIDAQADFLRNKSYLQQFLYWYFNEKTNVIKQVYPTGTIFWARFDIFKKVFFKYNIQNIFNSFNNLYTFDANWYYFANKQYLHNIGQDPKKLYNHFQENKNKLNISGNLFDCIKNSTNSEKIRDGMIEHAYERFFGYLNHRLGYKFKFMD